MLRMNNLHFIDTILMPGWKEMAKDIPLEKLLDNSKLRITPNADLRKLMGHCFSQREESLILNRRIEEIKRHSLVRGRELDVFKEREKNKILKLQNDKRQLIIEKNILLREIAALKLKLHN